MLLRSVDRLIDLGSDLPEQRNRYMGSEDPVIKSVLLEWLLI